MSAIVDRIKKLLALARDKGASEAEAATAMRMASELMLKHNIDEPTEEVPTVGYHQVVYEDTDKWVYWLGRAAALIYSCKEVETTRGGKRGIGFIGRPDNTEAAFTTLVWLVDQVEEQYKLHLPRGLSKGARAEFRRTFKYAAALRVVGKAQEIVKHNKLTGKALLVIDQRKAEADEFFKSGGGRSIQGRSHKPGMGSMSGYAAGDSIKLNEATGRPNQLRIGKH